MSKGGGGFRVFTVRAPNVSTPRGGPGVVLTDLDNTSHGKSGSWTHKAWCQLRTRCRARQEALYGPWKDFLTFERDVGKRPPETNLTRLDASRPWEPGNVRWGRWNAKTRTWE